MMTAANLERRLRFVLSCSRIEFKTGKGYIGKIEVDAGDKVITLPPDYDDHYTLMVLIHELAHIAIVGELAAFGVFEELILQRVIEPCIIQHIVDSPRKHAWWIKELRQAREAWESENES